MADLINRVERRRTEARRCVIAWLLVLSSAACFDEGGRAGTRVEIDTVGGIPVVRNAAVPLWREGEGWSVAEELRLGGIDVKPEEVFGSRLVAVSFGPQGQLYVLDFQSHEIRVFDGSGEFLRMFGGAGEGPGELDGPSSLGWDGLDRLWVPNAFDGRYTVFDSLGSVVKTARIPGGRAINRLLYPAWFDGHGGFVDHVAVNGDIQLIRRDTTAAAIDTLALIRQPPGGRVPRGPMLMYPETAREALRTFLPRVIWTIAPDGTLWEGNSNQLRLVHRTAVGDTLQIIETRHRPAEFTPREQALVDRALHELGTDVDFQPQVLQALYALEDGHVLAQIAGEMNTVGDTVDVFDPEGRYLGSVGLPFALEPKGLTVVRGDTIVGVTLGEMDVPYVVRAVIRRQ